MNSSSWCELHLKETSHESLSQKNGRKKAPSQLKLLKSFLFNKVFAYLVQQRNDKIFRNGKFDSKEHFDWKLFLLSHRLTLNFLSPHIQQIDLLTCISLCTCLLRAVMMLINYKEQRHRVTESWESIGTFLVVEKEMLDWKHSHTILLILKEKSLAFN